MACIAAYTGANTIFVEYKCAESHLSAWLQEVQVAHSSRHACFLCLSVHALNCPVSDGWTQSISFLHIKELISGGLQGMYRGCCPRLLRCSFCTCMQLGNLSSTNISKQKYFLYSNSISCSPALVLFLPPPNTWRDFRARIVPALARKKISILHPPLQSQIQLQLSWISTLKKTQHWKPRTSSYSGGRQCPEESTLLFCAKDDLARERAAFQAAGSLLPCLYISAS